MRMKPAIVAVRQNDLAAIHIAKKQLELPEDEYRDLMATVCGGIRSSAKLDAAGRQRFLAHLHTCLRERGIPAARPTRKQLPPDERKVWALWMQLADAGEVQERTMKAIDAWVRQQLQVDTLRFLNDQQMQLAIERLKQWLRRVNKPKVAP